MSKIEQLLKKAEKFEALASAERFADVIRDYDTGPLMVDDFIEGLKASTEKGYDNGKGFSKETYDLLQKQITLISAALEGIKPELAAIDEEIYSLI